MATEDKVLKTPPMFYKLLAFFFPPIAILLTYGFGGKFILNIFLTIIGWLPGVIHAFMSEPKQQQLVTT